jgi:DNA polymerase-3 subunit gamma/tau
MLGLADRSRILDLFEKVISADIAGALAGFRALYNDGADPITVMQDLLETTHFLTRVKVAPGAEGFFDGGSAEAARAAALAAKLPVPALTRCWQMLLKGVIEVRDAANPCPAAEMALVRLAYAADLPPTDQLLRRVRETEAAAGTAPSPPRREEIPSAAPAPKSAAVSGLASAPVMMENPAEDIRTLDDIVRIAHAKGEKILATVIESNVHLISMRSGQIVFRPNAHAPKNLAHDLSRHLQDWTGRRWIVTLATEGGGPTIAESRIAAERARKDAAAQEPFVRAVLDAFPGAEIISVREPESFEPAVAIPEEESNG